MQYVSIQKIQKNNLDYIDTFTIKYIIKESILKNYNYNTFQAVFCFHVQLAVSINNNKNAISIFALFLTIKCF